MDCRQTSIDLLRTTCRWGIFRLPGSSCEHGESNGPGTVTPDDMAGSAGFHPHDMPVVCAIDSPLEKVGMLCELSLTSTHSIGSPADSPV